jgi:hypothetical protein
MSNFIVYTDDYKGFNQGLSNSLWNVAIQNAPYRTGNLRAQIKRIVNTQDEITLFYNSSLAIYLHFLEIGAGRVKRHKGFIENKTVPEIVYETIGFIQDPTNLSYSGIPSITLRTDMARGYERKMLRSVGLDPNIRVNAFERATMSLVRDQNYRQMKGLPKNIENVFENANISNVNSRTTSINLC